MNAHTQSGFGEAPLCGSVGEERPQAFHDPLALQLVILAALIVGWLTFNAAGVLL